MTSTNSAAPRAPKDQQSADVASLADDQLPVVVSYGHGRMPWFLKIAWLAFLTFIAWYVTINLLPALGTELGG